MFQKSHINSHIIPTDSTTLTLTNDNRKQKQFVVTQVFLSGKKNYSLMLHVLIDDVRLHITFELFSANVCDDIKN
jgi:hypothetical protein